MKRLILLAIAATIGLGLIQGEALAKNHKKSGPTEASTVERHGGKGKDGHYEKWQDLSPEQRRELQDRYRKFQEMSPEDQERMRRRYERFKDLSPEKRQKMMERYQRIQKLSPERRQQLRNEWKKLKQLPPEQRRQRRQEIRREYFGDSDKGKGASGSQEKDRGRRR